MRMRSAMSHASDLVAASPPTNALITATARERLDALLVAFHTALQVLDVPERGDAHRLGAHLRPEGAQLGVADEVELQRHLLVVGRRPACAQHSVDVAEQHRLALLLHRIVGGSDFVTMPLQVVLVDYRVRKLALALLRSAKRLQQVAQLARKAAALGRRPAVCR